MGGGGLDAATAGTERDRGCADAERLGAKLVGKANAERPAGDAGMNDFSEGGVNQGGDGVPRIAAKG